MYRGALLVVLSIAAGGVDAAAFRKNTSAAAVAPAGIVNASAVTRSPLAAAEATSAGTRFRNASRPAAVDGQANASAENVTKGGDLPEKPAATVGDRGRALAPPRLSPSENSSTASVMMSAASRWMASDIPEVRQCGATMSIAWRESSTDPCSERAQASAEAMRARVEMCRKQRGGEDYVVSFGELLRTSDKWCGGPHCTSACGKRQVCFRARAYPFLPKCTECSPYAHVGPACDAAGAECMPACSRTQETFAFGARNATAASGGGAAAGNLTQHGNTSVHAPLADAVADLAAKAHRLLSRRPPGLEANAPPPSARLGQAEVWMRSIVPEERFCGKLMSDTWKSWRLAKCSGNAHTATLRMVKHVKKCEKLINGEAYVSSFGALLRRNDARCGGPHCARCAPGQVCVRETQVPFVAHCAEANITSQGF